MIVFLLITPVFKSPLDSTVFIYIFTSIWHITRSAIDWNSIYTVKICAEIYPTW